MMSETRSSATHEDDSPVEDVRRVRKRLSERFGNDVRKLGEHVRRIGEEAGRELGCEVVRKTRASATATTET